MDRVRALLAVTALLLSVLALLPAGAGAAAGPEGDANADVLRLHVIANSDSEADQRVKLLVRDAVLANMPAGDSAAEARAYLLANGAALLNESERVLRENGFSYGAQLMLGRFAFPDRRYGGAFFPAGEYEALRVVLGTGGGQNWWCVLFPPLCIVTAEGADAEQAAQAAARDGVRGAEPEGLRFESSLLKWIRSWGSGR